MGKTIDRTPLDLFLSPLLLPKCWFLLCIITSLSILEVQAQQFPTFRNYTSAEGLSQSTVYCLLEDSRGFLWVGTRHGLNRFDGQTFKHYYHKQGDSTTLPDDIIEELLEDCNGNIVVHCKSGLAILDPRTGKVRMLNPPHKTVSRSESLTSTVMCIDKDNVLYVILAGRCLYKCNLSNGHWSPTYNGGQRMQDTITFIGCSHTGTVYCSGKTSAFIKLEHSESFRQLADSSLRARAFASANIHSLLLDNHGRLWIFSLNSISYLRDDGCISNLPITTATNILNVRFDERGEILVLTTSGVFKLISDDRINFKLVKMSLDEGKAIDYNSISDLLVDKRGRLWIATENGLRMYSASLERFKMHQSTKSRKTLSMNEVRSISQTSSTEILVGETNGNIDSFDPTTSVWRATKFNEQIATLEKIYAMSVNSILVSRGGHIWLGTTNMGLVHADARLKILDIYSQHPLQLKNCKTHLCSMVNSYTVVEDDDGSIWTANYLTRSSSASVYHIIPSTKQIYEYTPTQSELGIGKSIWTMTKKSPHELYLGTSDGVFTFNKVSKMFSKVGQLKIADVWTILLRPGGKLWCGSWGSNSSTGACIYDTLNGKTEHIPLTSELSNPQVYSIEFDQAGCAWLSTSAGLTYYNTTTKYTCTFNSKDGLSGSEFSPKASCTLANGEIWFGGLNGIVSVHANSLTIDTIPSSTVITSFKVFDSTYYDAMFDGDHIELEKNQNFFTIEMASLDPMNPSRNQYAYYFEGLNTSWVQCGSQRTISFANVGSGTYQLHLRSSNSDGVWDKKGMVVTITIRPPVWEQLWLQILVLALMVSGGLYTLRVRAKGHRDQQAALQEARAAERRSIASDIHDGPLQDLYGMRFILRDGAMSLSSRIERLESVTYNVRIELGQICRDLRSISKDAHLPDILSALLSTYQKKYPDISFSIVTKGEFRDLSELMVESMYFVIRTALTNVIKHAKASSVTIVLDHNMQALWVRVVDDGVGFDSNQPINDSKSELTGHGFALCEAYAKSCSGDFKVVSSTAGGTAVEFKIPLRTSILRRIGAALTSRFPK